MVDAETIEDWGTEFIDLIMAITERPDGEWRSR
jgi:hypothetical protein